MTHFPGYPQYQNLHEQRSYDARGVNPGPEGLSLLGRTLLVLGALALVCLIAGITLLLA